MAACKEALPDPLCKLLDEKPSLSEICEHVRTIKWFQLGIQLELDDSELREIKEDNNSVADRRTAMYQLWFRTQPKRSRRQLLNALKSKAVSEYKIASDYEEILREGIKTPNTSVSSNIESSLSDRVSSTSVYKIARSMINWEELSLPLGLTQSEIVTIKRDHRRDYNQQKIAVLHKWIEKNGCNATYDRLVEIVSPISRELGESIESTSSSTMAKHITQSSVKNDSKLSDSMIVKISQKIISWEDIAIPLGLTRPEIEVIKRNNKGDYNGQKMQLLFKWREKGGSAATGHKLVQLLLEYEEHNELADDIRKLCDI